MVFPINCRQTALKQIGLAFATELSKTWSALGNKQLKSFGLLHEASAEGKTMLNNKLVSFKLTVNPEGIQL